MENLILLENDVSSKKPLDASGVSQNLQECAVNVSKEDSNPMGSHKLFNNIHLKFSIELSY